MAHTVRIGLIGTSWWADMMFLPSLKSYSQADLVAICGRNQARAQELAAKYQVAQVFADYRQMIAHAGLDAVIIATPDDLHSEMTMAALDAGLHVLCDKPMALNAQQAREMAKKAQAVRVNHMVYYTYRWFPAIRFLQDLVDQGYIGRVYNCEFDFLLDMGRSPDYQWRYDGKRSNGTLADLGSHMIDTARFLVGDIVSVSASLGVFVKRTGSMGETLEPANDSALLLVEFANGAHGVIQTSEVVCLADRGPRLEIKLYGEAGSLELDFPWGERPTLRGTRSQETHFQAIALPESYLAGTDPADPWSIFMAQPVGARQFIDAILAGQPVSPNFWDGYKNQLVIDAAIESHKKKAVVTIRPDA
jgi:predicted dehydrogenase